MPKEKVIELLSKISNKLETDIQDQISWGLPKEKDEQLLEEVKSILLEIK